MNASISAGRSTRASLLSKTSFATRAAVLISVSRMFDCSGFDEHLVGHTLGLGSVDGHADRREDVEVVRLSRQECLTVHRKRPAIVGEQGGLAVCGGPSERREAGLGFSNTERFHRRSSWRAGTWQLSAETLTATTYFSATRRD